MGNDNNHSAQRSQRDSLSLVGNHVHVCVCVCVCVQGIRHRAAWPFIWLRWHCKPIQCIVQWANTKQRLNAFCMLPLPFFFYPPAPTTPSLCCCSPIEISFYLFTVHSPRSLAEVGWVIGQRFISLHIRCMELLSRTLSIIYDVVSKDFQRWTTERNLCYEYN